MNAHDVSVNGAVFDFGGVICRAPSSAAYAGLSRICGLSPAELEKGFALHRRAYDSGEVECDGLYRRILADLKPGAVPEWDPEDLFRADSVLWTEPEPATVELMREIAGEGAKVGILTNMPERFYREYFLPLFPEAAKIASTIVVSGCEKCAKPDARIYETASARMGLPGGALAFFDDSPANVEGAIAAGWNAAVFTSPEAAKEFWRGLRAGA